VAEWVNVKLIYGSIWVHDKSQLVH